MLARRRVSAEDLPVILLFVFRSYAPPWISDMAWISVVLLRPCLGRVAALWTRR